MRPRGLEPPPGKSRTRPLNLVGRVIELSIRSICRDSSADTDDLDAYGEAFGITLVSRRTIAARLVPVVGGQGDALVPLAAAVTFVEALAGGPLLLSQPGGSKGTPRGDCRCSSRTSISTRSVEEDRFQRNVDLPGLLVGDLERG
jgi:hypothetical protein